MKENITGNFNRKHLCTENNIGQICRVQLKEIQASSIARQVLCHITLEGVTHADKSFTKSPKNKTPFSCPVVRRNKRKFQKSTLASSNLGSWHCEISNVPVLILSCRTEQMFLEIIEIV
jgi:hypothetical protein